MIRNKNKANNGITLIALVITIIVLLILAGVTIATLTGDNGILTKTTEAKEESTIGEEKEKIQLSATGALAKNNGREITETNLVDELTKYIGTRDVDYELTGTGPFIVKYSDSQRSYLIDENGNVSEYVNIAEYVKVGDYVNYNPTALDKSGTLVEQFKLEYSSPKGDGTSHGNGYNTQTFTAKSDIKWRVLSIENGEVTLISESAIKTDNGSDFTIEGAIGYLYAERELNEICKIYGYGYGANTSQVTQYTYGGPLDEEMTGKIVGSGARSIKMEDIDKKIDAKELEELKENIGYGNTTNPIVDVYYPTVTTSDGKSISGKIKNCKDTSYGYSKNIMINSGILLELFFNEEYWIASRVIDTKSSEIDYEIMKGRRL